MFDQNLNKMKSGTRMLKIQVSNFFIKNKKINCFHFPNNTKNGAIIIPPHYPGGSQDPRVQILSVLLNNRGFKVITFDYNEFSDPEINYDAKSEVSQALSVFNWLKESSKQLQQIWILGVEFGAWIGMQLVMRYIDIQRFIIISPSLDECDFSFLAPCPKGGRIIYGKDDLKISEKENQDFAYKLHLQQGLDIKAYGITGCNSISTEAGQNEMILIISHYLDKFTWANTFQDN